MLEQWQLQLLHYHCTIITSHHVVEWIVSVYMISLVYNVISIWYHCIMMSLYRAVVLDITHWYFLMANTKTINIGMATSQGVYTPDIVSIAGSHFFQPRSNVPGFFKLLLCGYMCMSVSPPLRL